MKQYSTIIWDFDGVILLSEAVRIKGFEVIFRDYPEAQVWALIDYHKKNGGLSRYVKIRYFFEEIRGEQITEEQVNTMAGEFSAVMRKELVNPDRLNPDWLNFMDSAGSQFRHHIASGSDGRELNFLCETLGIHHHFESINGSPTPKKEWVRNILHDYHLTPESTALIGDAINDYDAASANGIDFWGYNNLELQGKGAGYLLNLNQLIVGND